MTEGMRAFAKKYNRSLNDPKLRVLYELELSAQRDQKAIAYTERMEGHEEGVASERLATVHQALSMNLPLDVIYGLIKASRAEVDALIAKVRAEMN